MKKISLKILGVLTIIIMFAQVNVFAATKSELKENSSDTDKKIEEAKEELEGIQAEKSETLKQVESLITEISSYESEIDKLDEQISKLNNDIKDAENKLNQKQEDYKKEKELLEKRLVAGSQVSKVHSKYWWNNELEESDEYKLEFRTKESFFSKIEDEIKKIHNYETAEISYSEIKSASEEFLDWIDKNL